METRGTRIALGVWVGLVLLFLFVPIAIIASTRSTRRTCRAGRSRPLDEVVLARDPQRGRCSRRSGCR